MAVGAFEGGVVLIGEIAELASFHYTPEVDPFEAVENAEAGHLGPLLPGDEAAGLGALEAVVGGLRTCAGVGKVGLGDHRLNGIGGAGQVHGIEARFHPGHAGGIFLSCAEAVDDPGAGLAGGATIVIIHVVGKEVDVVFAHAGDPAHDVISSPEPCGAGRGKRVDHFEQVIRGIAGRSAKFRTDDENGTVPMLHSIRNTFDIIGDLFGAGVIGRGLIRLVADAPVFHLATINCIYKLNGSYGHLQNQMLY